MRGRCVCRRPGLGWRAFCLCIFLACAANGPVPAFWQCHPGQLPALHLAGRVGRIDMPLTAAITLRSARSHLGNRDAPPKFAGTHSAMRLRLRWPAAQGADCRRAACDGRGPRMVARRSALAGVGNALVGRAADVGNRLAMVRLCQSAHRQSTLGCLLLASQLERGLGGSDSTAAHPWWFYGPRALVDLLPWSLLGPAAIYGLFRNEEIRKDKNVCLGLTWFAAMTLFLSCMSFKRADYLLPAYPGLAIFLAPDGTPVRASSVSEETASLRSR